ncbi:MAG: hypothetical protein MR487_06025 [Lachnospiraceae bacterium]|nr:hypothetical protein [Lachnospiraceae bacterium]
MDIDRLIYYSRYLIFTTSFMAVVACLFFGAPAVVLVIALITFSVTVIVSDPFCIVSDRLAPQTRKILSFTIITGSILGFTYYYWDNPEPLHPGIAAFVITFLLFINAIARYRNTLWMDRYKELDCPEVSCALVQDKEYKYIRFWEKRGLRICRSLLHFHLHRDISDQDMDHIIRPTFIAGMAASDEYTEELMDEIEYHKKELEQEKKRYIRLQENIEQIVAQKIKSRSYVMQQSEQTLKKNIANQKERINELQKELKEEKSKTWSLTSDISRIQEQNKTLQDEKERVEEKIKHFTSVLSGVTPESYEDLLDECSQYRELYRQATDYQAELLADYNQLQESSMLWQHRAEMAEGAAAALQEELDAMKTTDTNPDQTEIRVVPVSNKGGRPSKVDNPELIRAIQKDRAETKSSYQELAEKYHVSKSSIGRILATEIDAAV